MSDPSREQAAPMRFACPHCGKKYKVSGTVMPGKRMTCKSCGEEFPVANEAATLMPSEVGIGPDPTVQVPKAVQTEAADGMIGRRIAGCHIRRKLGQGGMGAVYLAHHEALDIEVAVKILPQGLLAQDAAAADRFLREARSAAKLRHPNVVGVLNVGQEDGLHFIVMDFIQGETLKQRLEREGRLAPADAGRIIGQVCDALEAAREASIVHRDIKPDNVLLDEKGKAYLADLGLAKQTEAAEHVTLSGVGMGTPTYMAPEQAQNARDADHRSDLYALGCTLYRCVSGKVPYEGASLFQIINSHVNAPIPDVCQSAPDAPPALSAVIQRLMAKNPDDRYQTAGAVKQALVEAVAEAGGAGGAGRRGAKPIPETPPVGPLRSSSALRRFWWIPVAAVALLLVLALLAAWSKRARQRRAWQAFHERFDEAERLAKAGDLLGALGTLEAMRGDWPEDSPQGRKIAQHLKEGEAERARVFGERLKEAERHAKAGEIPEALELLHSLEPFYPPESPEHQELRRHLETGEGLAELMGRVEEARRAYEARDLDHAREILQSIQRDAPEGMEPPPAVRDLWRRVGEMWNRRRVETRARAFLTAMIHKDMDRALEFVHPAARERFTDNGVRMRLGVMRGFLALGQLEPRDVRVGATDFAPDFARGTVIFEMLRRGEWRPQKPSHWRREGEEWFVDILR